MLIKIPTIDNSNKNSKNNFIIENEIKNKNKTI